MEDTEVTVVRLPARDKPPELGYEALPSYSTADEGPSTPPPPPPRRGEAPPAPAPRGAGGAMPAVSLSKAMLGVGVLAVPKAVALLGLAPALAAGALVAALTLLALHYTTLASSRAGLTRYSQVVREHAGVAGEALLDAALIVNGVGLLVVAAAVVGDALAGAAGEPGLLSAAAGDRLTALAVLAVLVVAPLVSGERLQGAAAASALGVLAVALWAALTVCLFLLAWADGRLHRLRWWPAKDSDFVGHGFKSALEWISVLPVLLVAFTAHPALGRVLREAQQRRGRSVDAAAGAAVALAAAVYAAVGVCSVGLFGGARLHANVLNDFTVDAIAPLVGARLAHAVFLGVRLGFLLSLVALFPLLLGPTRDALWHLLFRTDLRGPGLWLVTYGLLASIVWAGAALTSIWEPLVLIGSTAGALVTLIFPGVLALSMPEVLTDAPGARAGRVLGGVVLVVVGLAVGAGGVLRVLLFRSPLGGA